MRKYISIFIICMFVILPVFSANADEDDREKSLVFTKVIEVTGTDKNELFNRARLWFSSAFGDSKEVLEIVDKENGELVGKGKFVFVSDSLWYNCSNGTVGFNANVYMKDGRYKYHFGGFNHNSDGNASCSLGNIKIHCGDEVVPVSGLGKKGSKKTCASLTKNINHNMEAVINGLTDAMSKKSAAEDDW